MAKKIDVKIRTLAHAEGLDLPEYATEGSAGLDVMAALEEQNSITLASMQRVAIPTGLEMAIPKGYEMQIRPRSGLALKHGLTVLNAPATIDSDYRGEIKILLINLGTEKIEISRGMRIAQMVLAEAPKARLIEAEDLDQTTRNAGGFGSTGS